MMKMQMVTNAFYHFGDAGGATQVKLATNGLNISLDLLRLARPHSLAVKEGSERTPHYLRMPFSSKLKRYFKKWHANYLDCIKSILLNSLPSSLAIRSHKHHGGMVFELRVLGSLLNRLVALMRIISKHGITAQS
jgi:hypothetical protein